MYSGEYNTLLAEACTLSFFFFFFPKPNFPGKIDMPWHRLEFCGKMNTYSKKADCFFFLLLRAVSKVRLYSKYGIPI